MSKSLLSRSVWESLFSRLSGSRKLSRRRRSQDRRWVAGVAAESLENRIVPTTTVNFTAGLLSIDSDAAGDAVTVIAGSSFTDIKVNGVFTARITQATSNSISAIDFDGNAGVDTLTVSGTNQAINIDLSSVAKLTLTSTRDAVVVADTALDLGTSTVSGTLSIDPNGALTQSGKVIVSGLTTLLNAGNSITLTNSGNSFGTLELQGSAVSITEAGATDLGNSTVTGGLTVNSRGAITDSGILAISGGATTLTSVGNSITLDNPTSTFAGGDMVLSGTDIAVTDNSAVDLGKVTATGTLSVTSKLAGAAITGNGAIKVGGLATFTTTTNGAVDLDNTSLVNNFGSISVAAGTGQVDIREKSATTLAGVTAGVLNVTSNGAITDSGDVKASGNTDLTTTGGAITIDEGGSTFGGTLSLTGTNIAVTDNDTTGVDLASVTASGTLSITSIDGDITDSGNLKVTGRATFVGADAITLGGGGGETTNFGSLSVTGASATIQEDSATDLFTSTLTGLLDITSAGAVTDSGDLTVGTTTDVDAGTGKNVTLDSSGNELSGAVSTTGKKIVLNNTLATVLGTTTASGVGAAGSLTVTSGGNVTQSGATVLTVPGRATVTATGNDIVLTNANSLGSVSVEGADVSVTETNSVDLFSVVATDDFTVSSGGNITDSGTLTIGDVTTLVAGANDVTLDSAASTFGGDLVITSGANVSVKDSDAGGLNLGASTLTGALTLNTSGDITDSGAVTGVTALTLNAGSGGNITLDTTAFSGALSMTGEDASVTVAAAAINLSTTTLTGLLRLESTGAGGAVSNTGTVVVAGTTTIVEGAAQAVNLGFAGNSFTGTIVVTNGAAVTINNTTATDIGTSSATTLTVTSSGAVTDSGVITASDDINVTATGSAITLDQLAQGNTAGVTLAATGSDVVLSDTNGATDLGVITATGSFTLTSAGAITQASGAAATVGGLATFNAAAASAITLTEANNKFGSVSVNNSGAAAAAQITEKDATTLAASTITGALTVISGGAVTDSGTLSITGALSINAQTNNADITLDSTGSNFGSLTLKGVNVAVTENSASTIVDIIANNTFSLTSAGAVDDGATGDITVAGAATITATGNTITLGDSGVGGADNTVNFGSIGLAGSTVNVREDSSTNLATSTVTVDLTITSAGAVTDSGTLTVTGVTTIVATGFDITLDSSANSFTGSLFFTGKHVAATNDRATKLGDSTATGTFTIISNGNVTEDDGTAGQANLTITGTFTIDASAGAYTITIVDGGGANDDTFSTLPLVLIVGVGGTVNYTP